MMIITIDENLIRIIVLDISGIYATIYDEVTLPPNEVDRYISKYQNSKYKVVEI